jgi:hypothetical protein
MLAADNTASRTMVLKALILEISINKKGQAGRPARSGKVMDQNLRRAMN